MKNNDVAIIILNYMTWEDTLKEVKLCHDLLKIDYKDIIVIDNASPNKSEEELVNASIDKFVFLKSENNKGYASGNNIGLRYAKEKGYKYGLILNNDILIECIDLLEAMKVVFNKDSKVAVVNPDIYSPDGYLFNRESKKPTFFDFTIGMIWYKRTGRKINDIDGYGYIYRPQGCCMLLDLTKISEVDYLDENTFLYYEESILAEKLERKGYKCACVNTVSVIHNHSKTVKSSIHKNNLIKLKNDSFEYYLDKYRGFNKVKIHICLWFNKLKLKFLK